MMPHFMVDDQLQVHRKVMSLIENEGTAGAAAMGLWTLAGSLSQAKLSDGYVSLGDAARLLLSKPLATKLAKLLVKYELWDPVETGGWQFHDWRAFHKPGEQVRGERERRRELRTQEIIWAVRARDGDWCRYCGHKVNWNDRRGVRGGCYDHVDPGLIGGTSNLVVCCRSCNSRKARKTPEQAGMTLLPPRGTKHEPNLGLDPESESGSDVITLPRERDRDGAGLTHQGSDEVYEHGITTGPNGEVGRAGPPPAGSIPKPGNRPSPVGSGWHGWHGPPPDVEIQTCPTHGLELPCRRCTADHYAEETR